MSYNTWGVSWGTSWGVSWGTGTPSPAPAPAVIGGHFIPAAHAKGRRTLSNILTIYNKAKELPRKQTKELRDAISEFIPPEAARMAYVPDIFKVDYEALAANDAAYERFSKALDNIHKQIELFEINRQKEDDELLLIAIIACSIN